MEEEISAFNKNETWGKCEMPRGKKTVGCRWVCTIKYLADGTIEWYKATLVAQGYTKTYGWIILKLSHQGLKSTQFGFYSQ